MNHEQPDGPTPPRGLPREQYARTYVLLPPLAGADWARAVLEATWDLKRWTLGGSADDAGIGDLDYRRVIAVNPLGWGDDLGAFFDEWYPGIQYTAVEAETPWELTVKLGELVAPEQPPPDHSGIALCQDDQRWIAHRYGEGLCYTVGAKGCWLCATASAQRYFEIDPEATPLTVDAALVRADYNLSCSMKHTAMPKLGLEVVDSVTSAEQARSWLSAGYICFAEVLPKTLQHFVMVTEYRGDKFWMLDSWKNVEGWVSDHYPGVESWRLIRRYEEPEPPEPAPTVLVGFNDYPAGGNSDNGCRWLRENGLKGIICQPLFTGLTVQPQDYSAAEAAGIKVIVNLRYGWSVDKGGQGTLPPSGEWLDFVDVCEETIKRSRGVWGWTLGNEPNNPREWPMDTVLTASYWASIYNSLRARVPGARLAPGAIDPFYGPDSDCREWFRLMYGAITDADFIALHGYIRGPDSSLCWSAEKFEHPPLEWQGLNYLDCCKTLLAALPSGYNQLPVVITEFNHLWKDIEPNWGWVQDERAARVVSTAHWRAEKWNQVGGSNHN